MSHPQKQPQINSKIPLLRYRLYRLRRGQNPPSFQIDIQLGNEHFTAPLTTDNPQVAKQIYTRMLDGKVTPCTARDVLDDLQS